MVCWVIGDVHGCQATLEALLGRLRLRKKDHLWLTGDLVNRGPRSLDTLRWAKEAHDQRGKRFVVVLGNHDLHLISSWLGVRAPGRRDTLREILEAPDADELVGWLRRRPLLHHDGADVLVHAGIPPDFKLGKLTKKVAKLERSLRRRNAGKLFRSDATTPKLSARRSLLAFLTRVRCLDAEKTPTSFTGPPEKAPAGETPWFDDVERGLQGHRLFFGHWAASGLRIRDDLVGLDTGCLWGGSLTAFCRETGEVVQQERLDP